MPRHHRSVRKGGVGVPTRVSRPVTPKPEFSEADKLLQEGTQLMLKIFMRIFGVLFFLTIFAIAFYSIT